MGEEGNIIVSGIIYNEQINGGVDRTILCLCLMMMSIIIIINHGLDLIYFGLLVVANQFISVEVF